MFRHKKKYGQNFLTKQKEILEQIMEVSEVKEGEEILEIGPGEGALTELLLQAGAKVLNVEIDQDLEAFLRNKFSKEKNYRLIMGDILEVDLKQVLSKGARVVANIPYYITSPIIQKIIHEREYVREAFLMVQKEVGERICAQKGKERSALTLSVEYFAQAEYLFTIPKEYFTPIPKVDSAFISIRMKEASEISKQVEEELFFRYVKAGFSNKRKNLANNFMNLGYSKEKIRKHLARVGILETERAENLSLEEWFALIREFEGSKSESEKL